MAVAVFLLLIYLAVLIAALVVYLKYLWTLQRMLERCAAQNRSMAPGMVWLQLVPAVGLGWQFVNVVSLGRSLEKEFRLRGVTLKRPGQELGLTMGILFVAGTGFMWLSNGLTTFIGMRNSLGAARPDVTDVAGLLAVGFGLFLAAFVLWILYWVRLGKLAKRLDALPRPLPRRPWGQSQAAMSYPGGGYGLPSYIPPSYLGSAQSSAAPVTPGVAGVPGTQRTAGGSQCPACGMQFQGGNFCSHCGASQNGGRSALRL